MDSSSSTNQKGCLVQFVLHPLSDNNITGKLYNATGQLMQTFRNMQPSITYTLNLTGYSPGNYILRLESGNESEVQKIIKVQ